MLRNIVVSVLFQLVPLMFKNNLMCFIIHCKITVGLKHALIIIILSILLILSQELLYILVLNGLQ